MGRRASTKLGALEKEFWSLLALDVLEEFGDQFTIDDIMSAFRNIYEKNKIVDDRNGGNSAPEAKNP